MGCQLAQLVSPFFGVLFNVVTLTSVLQVKGREFMIKIQGLTKVYPTGKAALNCATYLLLSGSQAAGQGRWIPWMF